MIKWRTFPHDADAYDYSTDELEANWDRLHRGDCEPWPDNPALVSAWQAYHRGDFKAAYDEGLAIGTDGFYVANKAAGIHAVYLEDLETAQLACYQEIAQRCEKVQSEDPDNVNAHYFHAFALGRYSQGISITKALTQGLGTRIKASLDWTLELEPDHADAHTASGLYHAEIIDKVGKMVGKLTYGASRDKAIFHFEQAARVFPESAIAKIEYANGLLMLDGDRGYDQASDLYVTASEAEPVDAMERLDVELARAELE